MTQTVRDDQRAWLPILRLLLRLKGGRVEGASIGRHPEMTNWEVYALAWGSYGWSYLLLGCYVIPMLEPLVGLGKGWWLILIGIHALVLHGSVWLAGELYRIGKPVLDPMGVTALLWQSAWFIGWVSLAALVLVTKNGACVGVAWSWLGFVGINLLAWCLEKIISMTGGIDKEIQ